MKFFFTSIALILLASSNPRLSIASPPASPATTGSPFDPIAFLVGGVWRGELPSEADAPKKIIELRCDWATNHQGIRFDGAFVVDGKSAPYTSGIYNWNAAKRRLVFVYSDAEGDLTEGAVDVDKGALIHTFAVTDVHGKVSNARAIITPRGSNAYTSEILIEKDGSLQKLVSVNYRRDPALR